MPLCDCVGLGAGCSVGGFAAAFAAFAGFSGCVVLAGLSVLWIREGALAPRLVDAPAIFSESASAAGVVDEREDAFVLLPAASLPLPPPLLTRRLEVTSASPRGVLAVDLGLLVRAPAALPLAAVRLVGASALLGPTMTLLDESTSFEASVPDPELLGVVARDPLPRPPTVFLLFALFHRHMRAQNARELPIETQATSRRLCVASSF